MSSSRILIVALACCLLSIAALASSAQAAAGPAWSFTATPEPANLAPGATENILLAATNVGAAATTGPAQIKATLPPALTPLVKAPCAAAAQIVTCEVPSALPPGITFETKVGFKVAASPSGSSTILAAVSGGGAQERTSSTSAPFQVEPVPFQILPPGLLAPLTEEDGAAATLAAAHPYQQTVSFQFPTLDPAGETKGLVGSGHPHEIIVDLPPGLIGNPTATPVLCTEAQFENSKCPNAAAVGLLEVVTAVGDIPGLSRTALYNMVPPPGAPAELATDVAGVGVFAHLIASVRSDGDYGIEVAYARHPRPAARPDLRHPDPDLGRSLRDGPRQIARRMRR